jgi:hypothetical protein
MKLKIGQTTIVRAGHQQELEYRKAYQAYKNGNYHSEREEDKAWDDLQSLAQRLHIPKNVADDIRIDVDESQRG